MKFRIRNKINKMLSYGKLFKLFNGAKSLVSRSSVYKAGDVDEFHKKMHFNSMLNQALNLVQDVVWGKIYFCRMF